MSETTTTSWLSRLGNSLWGMIFGPVVLVAAMILLRHNEFRYIQEYQDIMQASKIVMTVPSDTVQDNNNGLLIHTTGLLQGGVLRDEQFGIQTDTIALERKVQIYQWQEVTESQTQDNLGGSQTTTINYRYEMVWSDELIDSSGFREQSGHVNPQAQSYASTGWMSDQVQLGAFTVQPSLAQQISIDQSFDLTGTSLSGAMVVDNTVFIGKDLAYPQVGDMKISWNYLPSGSVASIIAGQMTGGVLGSYMLPNKRTIDSILLGNLSSTEMIDIMHSGNTMLTWILRVVGIILCIVAISLILKIAQTLSAVLPLLSTVVGWGLGFVSFIVGLSIALLTISVAWIAARPLVALGVIGAIIATVVAIYYHKNKQTTI